MRKYIWLLVLAAPPWLASEMDAPTWAVLLAVVPFFLAAMRLGDPEEDLLGELGPTFRKAVVLPLLVGGIVLACTVFALWHVFFPGR